MADRVNWCGAGIRTVMASPWSLLMARIFGERVEGRCEVTGLVVVGRIYRGAIYLTDTKEPKS